MCAKVIVQAGIAKVVYDKEGELNIKWKRKYYEYESSRTMLQKCLGLGETKLVLTRVGVKYFFLYLIT